MLHIYIIYVIYIYILNIDEITVYLIYYHSVWDYYFMRSSDMFSYEELLPPLSCRSRLSTRRKSTPSSSTVSTPPTNDWRLFAADSTPRRSPTSSRGTRIWCRGRTPAPTTLRWACSKPRSRSRSRTVSRSRRGTKCMRLFTGIFAYCPEKSIFSRFIALVWINWILAEYGPPLFSLLSILHKQFVFLFIVIWRWHLMNFARYIIFP